MPPRHAYWTILIDDQPTAFRAHDPEELLPTLNRLREKNESAVMKWFERGQLFDSRDAAREAGLGRGERRWEGPRPARDEREADRPARDFSAQRKPDERRRAEGDRPRDKTWRPGGEHRDPRQKYKDAKKDKWNRFKQKIRDRHEERVTRSPESFSPPHGDPLRDKVENRPPRPTGPARAEDRDGAPSRPHGDKFRDRAPRPRADFREDSARAPRPRSEFREETSRAPRPPRTEWRGGDDDRRGGGYRDRKDSNRGRDDWRNRPPRAEERRADRPWRDDRDVRPTAPRAPRPDSRDRQRSDWRDTDRPPRRDDDRRDGPKTTFGKKPFGKKPFGKKPFGKKPFTSTAGGRKPWGAKPEGRKPTGRPGGLRSSHPPRRRRDDED